MYAILGELVDALARVPVTETYNGRTFLLFGIEQEFERSEYDPRLVDLQNIVEQLYNHDGIESLTNVLAKASQQVNGSPLSDELVQLQQRLQEADATQETPEESEEGELPPSPYHGLRYYDWRESETFFGRDALTRELLQDRGLAKAQSQGRFLAIVGPSGSGKSSFARAGLLANLCRQETRPNEHNADFHPWPEPLIVQPGARPLETLALALKHHPDTQFDEDRQLIAELRENPHRLREAIEHITTPQQCCVLLLDQFEEFFTQRTKQSLLTENAEQAEETEAAENQAFLENIFQVACHPESRTIVILTLRTDFYGNCLLEPKLQELFESRELENLGPPALRQYRLDPIQKDELAQVITAPAKQRGYTFEPALLSQLIREIDGKSAVLPLLQLALHQLWKRQDRKHKRLLMQTYADFEGINGAPTAHANEVYNNLSTEEQEVCKRVFLRLVQTGEGTEDTKRQVPVSMLLPRKGNKALVESVLVKLSKPGVWLLTCKSPSAATTPEITTSLPPDSSIEVAHEVLIRRWKPLQEWLRGARKWLRWRDEIDAAAARWQQEDDERKEDYLLTGFRLEAAESWATQHEDDLNALEESFLAASVAKRERDAKKEETRRQKEEQRNQERTAAAQAKEAALNEKEAALNEREAALNEREATLNNTGSAGSSGDKKADALDKKADALKEREAALDKREAALKEREAALDKKATTQDKETPKHLQEQEAALDKKAAVLDKKAAVLDKKETALQKKEATLKEKEAAVKGTEGSGLEEQAAALEEREAAAQKQAAAAQEKEAALQKREAALRKKEAALQAQESGILGSWWFPVMLALLLAAFGAGFWVSSKRNQAKPNKTIEQIDTARQKARQERLDAEKQFAQARKGFAQEQRAQKRTAQKAALTQGASTKPSSAAPPASPATSRPTRASPTTQPASP